jgi:hypothetical protein
MSTIGLRKAHSPVRSPDGAVITSAAKGASNVKALVDPILVSGLGERSHDSARYGTHDGQARKSYDDFTPVKPCIIGFASQGSRRVDLNGSRELIT